MPLKREIKDLIRTEKRLISMIKKDAELVKKKTKEKDISKVLKIIDQQEILDAQEIQSIENELKEEEGIIDEEWSRLKEEKKKKLKEFEEKELVDEIHHLRIVYVLIPLIRQKNESLKKQKELLTERRGEFTIGDLPMLIKKEKEALDKIRPHEEEAEELLKKIEKEEMESTAPNF